MTASGDGPAAGATVARVEATERFADLVQRPTFPLDEAALLVAVHGDERCDVDRELVRLDDLADRVPGDDLESLLRAVFGAEGFVGDPENYHDPRNSYLHEVVARRRGIPITLSIVLIEVGRRIGVTLDAIGAPRHFLTAPHGAHDCWIDAFAGGVVLDRAALDTFLAGVAPGVDPEPYLAPLHPADVLRRVLANLIGIHRQRADRDGLLWAARLRTLLPGADADDQRTYAGALAASGDFTMAAKVFESLAEDIDETEEALATARRLRARLN